MYKSQMAVLALEAVQSGSFYPLYLACKFAKRADQLLKESPAVTGTGERLSTSPPLRSPCHFVRFTKGRIHNTFTAMRSDYCRRNDHGCGRPRIHEGDDHDVRVRHHSRHRRRALQSSQADRPQRHVLHRDECQTVGQKDPKNITTSP